MSDRRPMDGSGTPFGQYTLVDRIGRGGMAEIWRARLQGVKGFEKSLVIKKILPSYARRRSFIEMFIQEAKLCSGLQHGNIVQIFELGEVKGEYYIAMEYVAGWDLLRVLYHASRNKIEMPQSLSLFIVREICRALAYAHAAKHRDGRPLGIVHLDVSPSNVLLSEDGGVKLTDFGVARAAIERTSGDASASLRGKVSYMSPEQVAGVRVDLRSDLFSAGIVLYELLTQKRLFRARTAVETLANVRAADIEPRLARHPEIPAAIQSTLRRALCRSRKSRYQSAAELGADIESYLFDGGVRVGPRDLAAWLERHMPKVGASTQIPAKARRGSRGPWESSVMARTQGRRSGSGPRESSYVFRKTSGSGFGPIPHSAVLKLVRRRAVLPEELVSVDGADWRPARRISALADAMAEAFPKEPGSPDDEGLFDSDNAVRVLARLGWLHSTGCLRVERDGVQKDVYVRRGRVQSIVSNRKDELFGPFLLERGVVNPVQLQVAFSQARSHDDRIGTVLVQLGFLDHAQVFRLLERQMYERFTELLSWKHGRYAFFDDQACAGKVSIELDPIPAVVDGVRSNVPMSTTVAYFNRRGNPRLHWVSDPPFDAELLRFSAREFRFVSGLSGPARTVRKMVQQLAGGDADKQRTLLMVLYVLHQTGHLRMVDTL